jgi:restriction endonuclease S subunit
MEMKPGYKHTQVGVIPTEWDVLKLSQVADLQVGFAFRSAWFRELSGTRLLRGENVGYGVADWSDTRTLEAKMAETFRAYMLKPGDIVIGMDRTFTKSGMKIAALRDDDCPCLLVQRVGRFISKRCDQRFLWFVLSSETVQSNLRLAQKGMDIPHLSRAEILHPLAAFPPLPEQKAIAAVLSDVDALLGALDGLIAKKRDLKKAAMQQLLTGQTRLPGFRGNLPKRMVADVGEVPADWRVLEIGSVASVKTGPFGSSLHEQDYVSTGTPIVTVEHLGERGIQHFDLPMVSDADRRRLSAYSLLPGDIVFSRVGSVDRNALVSDAESGWLFSGRLLRVRAFDRNVDTRFLSHHFHSEPFKQRVRSVAVGQTMPSLNTRILKGVLVVLPPLREQSAIADILSDMDAEITALEQRKEKTRLLKQAMMQGLLMGRTRLV